MCNHNAFLNEWMILACITARLYHTHHCGQDTGPLGSLTGLLRDNLLEPYMYLHGWM